MNEIKYLPVKVIREDASSSSVYAEGCGEGSKLFSCINESLKSPFEIKEVKDYIDILHVYNNLPCDKCNDIWGTYYVKDILDMSPEYFVNKYKEYKNAPKVGEIWVNEDGYKVIIIGIEEVGGNKIVEYWTCNGFWKGEEHIDKFIHIYKNTNVSCGSLSTFIKEFKDKNSESDK